MCWPVDAAAGAQNIAGKKVSANHHGGGLTEDVGEVFLDGEVQREDRMGTELVWGMAETCSAECYPPCWVWELAVPLIRVPGLPTT